MGLPLYVAPVESDIKSRSADKALSPLPRQTITRRRRRFAPRPSAERLLRLHRDGLAAEANNLDSAWAAYTQSHRSRRSNAGDGTQRSEEPRVGFAEDVRQLYRNTTHRMVEIQQRLNNILGEDWEHRYGRDHDRGAAPPPASDPPTTWQRRRNFARYMSDDESMPNRERREQMFRAAAYMRSAREQGVLGGGAAESPALPGAQGAPEDFGLENQPLPREASPDLAAGETGRADGLGDRNRSLSPEENYGVWHTLLSTLTPDPQPPSVGSSFASASASASAAASQTTGVSSTTPPTGPETADDPLEDHACDSGCEFCEADSIGESPLGPIPHLMMRASPESEQGPHEHEHHASHHRVLGDISRHGGIVYGSPYDEILRTSRALGFTGHIAVSSHHGPYAVSAESGARAPLRDERPAPPHVLMSGRLHRPPRASTRVHAPTPSPANADDSLDPSAYPGEASTRILHPHIAFFPLSGGSDADASAEILLGPLPNSLDPEFRDPATVPRPSRSGQRLANSPRDFHGEARGD